MYRELSYAQYHEDIILASLLRDTKKGFYVDVGANHEEYHSVTKYFYIRNWSGINIEPIPRLIKEFEKKRKRDINLKAAVSNKPGELKFREYPKQDGLSTFDKHAQAENEKLGYQYEDYRVPVLTLEIIFNKYVKNKKVDFLKVDVEGSEKLVLAGNNWKKYRPRVICIESNHRSNDDNWSNILIESNYELAIFDGLNEYYVTAEEKSRMLEKFAETATDLSHSLLREHHEKYFTAKTGEIRNRLEEYAKIVENLQAHLDTRTESLEKLKHSQRSIKYLCRRLVKEILTRLRKLISR